MPELPEVETIKLQLQKYLVKHRINDIQVYWKKTFSSNQQLLIGATIKAIRRLGKVLVFDFSNDYSLVVHVKMTGQLIYRGPNLKSPAKISEKVTGGIPGKHTRVIFSLDKKGMLYFNDLRKFGWMKVVKSKELKSINLLNKMGPEPLKSLTLKYLRIILNSNRAVKELIMDQVKIGGIGNIYANDALYLAKIHPTRKANSLKAHERSLLFNCIEEVIRRGIKERGASENSYVSPDGSEGNYQNIALVYGKKGKQCKRCKTIIEKIKLGGRGTFFCRNCQK